MEFSFFQMVANQSLRTPALKKTRRAESTGKPGDSPKKWDEEPKFTQPKSLKHRASQSGGVCTGHELPSEPRETTQILGEATLSQVPSRGVLGILGVRRQVDVPADPPPHPDSLFPRSLPGPPLCCKTETPGEPMLNAYD